MTVGANVLTGGSGNDTDRRRRRGRYAERRGRQRHGHRRRGSDTIDGGLGTNDNAAFAGSRADYTISLAGLTYTVVDNRGGTPDGTDTVTNVENFLFSDGTLTAAQLDTTAPTISSVTFGTHDAALAAGKSVDILVIFSEAVSVTGSPTITLNNGAVVALTSGGGTNTLTFHYTAAPGQGTSDITVASYNLIAGGATVKDAQGNPASVAGAPTDPSGAGDVLPVDGAAPVFSSGTVAAALDENSGAGQVVYTAVASDPASDGGPSNPLSYGLSGTDAGAFSIDPTSGAVTLTGDPDHESQASYSFTVTATDAAGNATTQTVKPGDQQPRRGCADVHLGDGAAAIDENSGAGQVVYTACERSDERRRSVQPA